MFVEERRKYTRTAFSTELWIGQDGIFTRNDESLGDLSIGGAFIESLQLYPVGSILNLRFKMPAHNNFITCTVIIRNQRQSGFGVEFLDLSPECRAQIQAIVEDTVAPY